MRLRGGMLAEFVVERPDQPGLLRKIDVKATAAAGPLYRDLGFTVSRQFTPMRLTLGVS